MTNDVRLIQLPDAAIHALAAGDLAAATRAAGMRLPEYFISDECRSTWRMRSAQIAADPNEAAWVTRAIVDFTRGIVVGRAGYHSAPDERGMVELGYAVDPRQRRRGYARAALEALLERAEAESAVRVVRATVRPDNVASRRLIDQYGFVAVGEQWDDEDGLETVLELGIAPSAANSA